MDTCESTLQDSPRQNNKDKKKKKRRKQAAESLDSLLENEDLEIKKSIQKLAAIHRERQHGDGESLPETPPNEDYTQQVIKEEMQKTFYSEEKSNYSESHSPRSSESSRGNPFGLNMEMDFMAIGLFVLGVATRMFRLEEPRHIVFDELHYGKYAGMYMKQTFFFDSHPPLGKQLISLAAYLAGFDGSFKFDRIGAAYTGEVPIVAMRFVPAMCGSLLIPTIYQVGIEVGLNHWAAALAGILALLDNALLTQSRFILMESILLFFAIFGLLCILKFRKYHSAPFSKSWWGWLILGSISITAAVCVKYIGVFSGFMAAFILGRDYWKMLADHTLSASCLLVHLIARFIVCVVVPTIFYVFLLYIHLSILTKAGPHDNVMTSAFQASLEGGLASITKGQPLEIVHGSQITLRHTHGRACWMHSHGHVYPVRYADGRGSSHQQQVTCYSFKDVNNWFIVKLPDSEDLVVSDPVVRIKHGDVIQLVHGLTSRALNSHDVAAPVSPTNQELSCYIDYNISMPSQNLWRVDIVNRDAVGDVWHTIESQIRLVHVNTSQALKFSGRQLPDWGFHQHEMVTDKVINQEDTIWNVEEHRYTKGGTQKDRELEMLLAEMIPSSKLELSFWDKFYELQLKMLLVNQENVQSHMYASDPTEWPFLTKGIAYWVSQKTNAQIHLLGNIAVWRTGSLCVVLYCCILVFYLLRRRRACYDIPEDKWEEFTLMGEMLLGGYLMHWIPYFFADRTLFLHHYLPALVFKILLTAAVIQHLHFILRDIYKSMLGVRALVCVVVLWLFSVLTVFIKFAPLCYGMRALSATEVRALRWKDTWDLIVHKS